MNVTIFGQHDDNTLAQFEGTLKAGSAVGGVLCADGHYGYRHPIGGVVGYTDHISISGVGFDIACGNMAIRTDAPYGSLKADTRTILADIAKVVSFGVGRNNPAPIDHEVFALDHLWDAAGVPDLKQMAQQQLGTVGSGNHYVDLFEGDDGMVWIGVHFGSRGLGHKITTKYLEAVGAKDTQDGDPVLLDVDSDLGRGYLAGLELGGAYAYAGREWVVEQVRQIIGGTETMRVHNHHNFAWHEVHDGVAQWVVRKGATPAFPHQLGFVGGSMGDNAVILKGIDTPLARHAMHSTVHGAGRVMSRTAARGKYDKRTGEVKQAPRVDRTEWQQWLSDRGVTLLGADLDEAPQAYRRLSDVLRAHEGTVEIVHQLRPFGVIMAGANEFDPYKD